MTTSFTEKDEKAFLNGNAFAWSIDANWTAHIPVQGGTALIAPPNPSGSVLSPDSYDDLASLDLNQLTLGNAALVGIGGILTIRELLTPGSATLFADSLLTGTPASLTIDGFGGEKLSTPTIEIGAVGAGAVTTINAAPVAADPGGETVQYEAAAGGMVVVAAAQTRDTPVFTYDTAPGLTAASGFGTFAFTAAALTGPLGSLNNVGFGDVLELPGTAIVSVTFGATAITVVTNLGTTSFAATYAAGKTPATYEARQDALTGLEAITFIATVFEPPFAETPALWSDGANWSNGKPQQGGNAKEIFTGNANLAAPDVVDDISSLTLSSLVLNENAGVTAVAGDLTVGNLFTDGGANYLIADTDVAGGPSSVSLTIEGASPSSTSTSSSIGFVSLGAVGAGAVTRIEADLNRSGANHFDFVAEDNGEVRFDAAQHGSPMLYFGLTGSTIGTFAFEAIPSTLAFIGEISVGDKIELPGTVVRNVTYTAKSIMIETDAGQIAASAGYAAGGMPTGFTSTADASTGLVTATFIDAAPTTFIAGVPTTYGTNTTFDWSDGKDNWTNGVPQQGGAVTVATSVPDPSIPAPASFDDPATGTLLLSTLTLDTSFLAIGANLTIGNLVQNGGAILYADSLIAGGPASLSIDGITLAAQGATRIGAVGPQAITWLYADANSPSAGYFVGGHATLVIAAAQSATPQITFGAQHTADQVGTVAFTSVGATLRTGSMIVAVLDGLGAGDAVEVPVATVHTATATFGAGSVSIATDAGEFDFLVNATFSPATYQVSMDNVTGLERVELDGPACFLRGTRVLTEAGTVAVETLRAGQHVITASGAARPIRWIGRRAYRGRFAARSPGVQPIRVAAGALGDSLPTHDLFLSAKHAVFLDGVLIAAEHLVNGASVQRVTAPGDVHYYHIELDSHDVIMAEGAPCETFLDDDNRAIFANAADYPACDPGAHPPGQYCAPRVESGPILEAVRRRLAAIAMPLARAA